MLDIATAKQIAEGKFGGSRKYKFLSVPNGGSVRIRFLWDYNDGFAIYRHWHVEGGKRSMRTCFQSYGAANCPYCLQGDRKVLEFVWAVLDLETNEIKIMAYRRTAYSPVVQLELIYNELGTLLDREFVLKRVSMPVGGNAGATSYHVIPGSIVKEPAPSVDREEVYEDLRPFEIRI